MGPLHGIRILEMAGIGPCPLAGQLLADMGASVTVVDRASGADHSGDVNRRNKRSIAVDAKSAGGRDLVLRLIEASDVLLEGFRPGVMERLGLGPQIALERNPGLIYGRMTGWGQEGPLSASAGHDLTYMAITGALNAMGAADRPPRPPLNLVADYGGGSMMLVTGVLAALVERAGSGKGQVIDTAMVDGVPALTGIFRTMMAQGQWVNRRDDNLLDGYCPFYRCYTASDGRHVAVGALEPQFFAVLVEKTGLDPQWRKRQMDKAGWPELTRTLEAIFAQKSRDEWAVVFEGGDGCVAPVLDWDEAPEHPHNRARRNHIEVEGVMQAAPAPRFSRTPTGTPNAGVMAGASSEVVLAEAGLDGGAIERLRAAGVLT